MKQLGIQQKIFLPIAGSLALIIGLCGWFFVSWQTGKYEDAHHEQMNSLSMASTTMFHSAAEEFLKEKGYRYDRVAAGSTPAASELGRLEANAFRYFEQHRDAAIIETTGVENNTQWMYAFASGRVKDECVTCHTASGVDDYRTKKTGDFVAVFSVSGPMDELIKAEQQLLISTILFAVGILGVIALIIRIVLKRVVLRPLGELTMQLELVGQGDLREIDTPILAAKLTSGDEFGLVARSFSGMMQSLRTMIRNVSQTTSTVALKIEEISSSVEQMASGMQQQSSQVHEVASAAEEMTKTVIENSKNTHGVANTSEQAVLSSQRGMSIVESTVQGMNQIAVVVQRSAETISGLGSSSAKIGEIITVIDDIADQTNLLALNAAIEAARAGDQGRGFAVVADEVRKLAERTTKATNEIAKMIRTIQVDTKHAVDSIGAGTEEVRKGIALSEKAKESLEEIRTVSQEANSMVSQIAAANEEQSTTSQEIAQRVASILAMTTETTNGTQLIARATEELNQLATDLEQVVKQFKLNEAASESSERSALQEKKNQNARKLLRTSRAPSSFTYAEKLN